MAFGQNFLQGFFGNDYLKDYTHASKTFTSAGYENSPRYKFLFHVFFNINTSQLPRLQNNLLYSTGEQSTIGLLVKNIELPKFRIDTEVMNQYNRKRVIQKKIEYQPIRCSLHDDGGDLIRGLWYNYYAYYYKDPVQPYKTIPAQNGTIGEIQTQSAGSDYNVRDIYSATRNNNDWGYIGETYTDATNSEGGKPVFFRDISIYGFNQHKFVEYVLINPMISEWNHDSYNYAEDGGTMENSMVINYETVKYYTGAIGSGRPSTTVQGFADPANYDQESSPLTRPGGTRSIIGQGGLLDAGQGIIRDLSTGSFDPIGAMQKAGTVIGTFRGADLRSVVNEEAVQGVRDVLRGSASGQNRAQSGASQSTTQNQAPSFNTPPIRRPYNNSAAD